MISRSAAGGKQYIEIHHIEMHMAEVRDLLREAFQRRGTLQ